MNYQAYIDIAKRISDKVPEVKHIDLFNDQYNQPGKENPFETPAVFVEFNPTPWQSMADGVQEGQSVIRIHVVFDFYGNSHNISSLTDEQQQQLFLHYTISKKIHRYLTGFAPYNCSQLERVLSTYDHNHDQLLIEMMDYEANEIEDSANECQDYVDSPVNDIIFNGELNYTTLEEYINSVDAAFVLHALNHSNKTQAVKDLFCEAETLQDKIDSSTSGQIITALEAANGNPTKLDEILNALSPDVIIIKGVFPATVSDLPQLIIDSDNAGIFTSIATDGASGNITISKNGGAYAAFSSPLVLVPTNTIDVRRTISTGIGFYKLTS